MLQVGDEFIDFVVTIVTFILGSFWSVMTLGMSSTTATNVAEEVAPSIESTNILRNRHLSNQSIHLLLILSNHFTSDVHRNPYRLALLHFTDTQGKRILCQSCFEYSTL